MEKRRYYLENKVVEVADVATNSLGHLDIGAIGVLMVGMCGYMIWKKMMKDK